MQQTFRLKSMETRRNLAQLMVQTGLKIVINNGNEHTSQTLPKQKLPSGQQTSLLNPPCNEMASLLVLQNNSEREDIEGKKCQHWKLTFASTAHHAYNFIILLLFV